MTLRLEDRSKLTEFNTSSVVLEYRADTLFILRLPCRVIRVVFCGFFSLLAFLAPTPCIANAISRSTYASKRWRNETFSCMRTEADLDLTAGSVAGGGKLAEQRLISLNDALSESSGPLYLLDLS